MFKKGSKYTRNSIWELYHPGENRPKGGIWDTGYARQDDDLLIFMNIGIPGATGHDFDNQYDNDTGTIIWFGKPNTHSSQPTFQKLISGELKPHFFARWDKKDFTYLGVGNIIKYEDGYPTKDSKGNDAETIKITLSIKDIEDILEIEDENYYPFSLEKQLEEFIVNNWDRTQFGSKYNIYEQNGELIGKQFQTGVGPCDILALSKDKKEFLIIELKKGRASDRVAGQLARYMKAVKMKLATNNEVVKGCVVAFENDKNLQYSLSMIPNTDFYKYEIKFNLEKIDKLN